MIDPQTLIGKPLVVFVDDEKRQIGTITRAALRDGSLFVGSRLHPEAAEAEDLTELMEQR